MQPNPVRIGPILVIFLLGSGCVYYDSYWPPPPPVVTQRVISAPGTPEDSVVLAEISASRLS